MGISSWIAHKAVWNPQKIAIRFSDRELNYVAFEKRIAHFAAYLADEHGVGIGDRVAYLGLNSPELLYIFFACARLGAIFVPLNSRMTAEQISMLLANCEPRCMLVEPSFRPTATQARTNCRDLRLVFLAGSNGSDGETLDVDRLVDNGRAMSCNPVQYQSEPVLIAYTSGTTGTPKGAVYTQDAITFSAINSTTTFNMRAADHVLTFLPMFHVGGLMIQTLPAFHAGATVTIHREFVAAEVLREIEQRAVTLILPPPGLSQALTSDPDWGDRDLSSIRCVAIGATNVLPEILQPWFDRNIPTQQLYGLTEGVPVLAAPWEHARRKFRAVGTSVLYCQARVVDEHLERLPNGEQGEIVLRGRSLFKEYWRNPEATQAAFAGGWFHTGDVGVTDEEGYFYVVDRIKNIVIVGSSNVYPADLERVLAESDAIAEAAVVGTADPDTGEALVACVVMRPSRSITEAEVRGLFVGRLAEYQHPKFVLFMESLPHTSLGKVQKYELRRLVDIELLRRPDPVRLPDTWR